MSLDPKQQPQNLKLMLIQTCELSWSWGTDGSHHLLKPSSCLSWVFLMSTCSRTNWYCFYSPQLQVLCVQISPGGKNESQGVQRIGLLRGVKAFEWVSWASVHHPATGRVKNEENVQAGSPSPTAAGKAPISQCAGSVEEASGQEITQLFNIPSKRLTLDQQGIRPYQTKHARSLTKNKTFN